MNYPKTHPAVRLVREGRYTVIVPEVDVAAIGSGSALHVLNAGKPVCGQKGTLGEILEGVDPRADVVMRKVVCGRCRDLVGTVPGPLLAEDVDGGHGIGVTRTELEKARKAARRAAA